MLVYADDVNLLGYNIDTVKKNTETLTDASSEVGLEVNAEQTMHMLLSRHQNAAQNHDIKIANRSFENDLHIRFGNDSNKFNLLQEDIKRKLNSSNACFVQSRIPVFSSAV
jgi:hypothetical protein